MTFQLRLALYVEGTTDERFLPTLIKRTCERLLEQSNNRDIVDVFEPQIIKLNPIPNTGKQRILQAARVARNYHALIIHCDADRRSRERAFKERYQPGWELVQQV
jgi:hypothetical protein